MGALESMPADAERRLMARLDSVLPGLVQPDEVAEAIAYLASDAARMITGTALLLDGGTQSLSRILRRTSAARQPIAAPTSGLRGQSRRRRRARGWRRGRSR